MEKDRHAVGIDSGSSVREKSGGLPAGGEWNTICSIEALVKKGLDGDEQQWATHQKLSNEPMSGSCQAIEFGSGSSHGVGVISKFGGASQNRWTVPRNDLEYAFPASGTSARMAGLNKQIVAQEKNKLNIPKYNQAGSHSQVTNAMQPASGSGAHTFFNSVQKHVTPTGASSSPTTQLASRRPLKFSQKRREDLVSSVSEHGEANISFEGFHSPTIRGYGPLVPGGVSSSTQQVKMEVENAPSPAIMFDRKEFRAGKNKLKKNRMHNGKVEDRTVGAVQKVGKKNKVLKKEKTGDGVQRKGKNGESSPLSRESIPPPREKFENLPATNSVQGTKLSLTKTKRKLRRSSLKELSDCNACSLAEIAFNNCCSDVAGESDDDHEELLAAANYARCANHRACSGSFWKRTEPIFAYVSLADTTYLHKQVDKHALSQTIVSGERQEYQRDGIELDRLGTTVDSVDQSQEINTSCGGLDSWKSFENAISLSQLLLSTLIEEDENEGDNHINEKKNGTFQSEIEHYPFGKSINTVIKPNDGDMMISEADTSARVPDLHHPLDNGNVWQESDCLVRSEVKVTCQSGQNNSDITSFHSQYQTKPFEDRCSLELQSLGIFHEKPCVEETEVEGIDKDINELQKKLHEQAEKNNVQLLKLKELVPARKAGGWDLEQIALDKLVEMAYRKVKACSTGKVPKDSKRKAIAPKDSKRKAIAFGEQTIRRCRAYEETGISCFREPALYDFISSVPQCSNVAHFAENYEAVANMKKVGKRKTTDVISNATSRARLANGNTPSSGAKGRSERDNDQHKDSKGKPRRKTKSKQKTAQPSTSGNGVVDKVTKTTHPVSSLETSKGGVTIERCKVNGGRAAII